MPVKRAQTAKATCAVMSLAQALPNQSAAVGGPERPGEELGTTQHGLVSRAALMPPDTPAPRPAPTCRRPGCPEPAASDLGFCDIHAARYLGWRGERDELEAADLAGRGYAPGDAVDAATAGALDALYEHLTPGPS